MANQYFASYALHHLPNFGSTLEGLLSATKVKDLALQLTALRSLANIFSTVHGAETMYRSFELIQQTIVPWSGLMDNRTVHLAYSALWFNFSVLLVDDVKKENTTFLNALMGQVAESDGLTSYGDTVGQLLNTFGNLLVAGGKTWTETCPLVKVHKNNVQAYPKTFADAYEVRRAVSQINRL